MKGQFENLKTSKFEALNSSTLSKIIGGGGENGNQDTPATEGTNKYDSGEADHGKATSDCITFKDGLIIRQEFWHADGFVSVWEQ